jgi:hypothetical protein
MMAQRVDKSAEEARAAHETTVGLHVAWLVALARASRLEDDRALRLDADIRTAQAHLIRALLLACADGRHGPTRRATSGQPRVSPNAPSGAARSVAARTTGPGPPRGQVAPHRVGFRDLPHVLST